MTYTLLTGGFDRVALEPTFNLRLYGSPRVCTIRYGTVRYGTVRYGTVRYGTVRYGTVRYVTPRHVTSRHVTSRHVTSRHVTSRHVTSRHVTSRHVTSRHVTSRHVTSRHVTSRHVTIQYNTYNCQQKHLCWGFKFYNSYSKRFRPTNMEYLHYSLTLLERHLHYPKVPTLIIIENNQFYA